MVAGVSGYIVSGLVVVGLQHKLKLDLRFQVLGLMNFMIAGSFG